MDGKGREGREAERKEERHGGNEEREHKGKLLTHKSFQMSAPVSLLLKRLKKHRSLNGKFVR